MKKKYPSVNYRFLGCLCSCVLLCLSLQAQDTLDVSENTMKVGGFATEEFYFGFAEGDQLVFDFEELKGKELKELEILEWPSTSRFMDYKTTKVSNKTLLIQRTGIYKFRLYNSAMGGRICKMHLRRVPASSATRGFNTNVYNRVIYDTTYITEQESYLVRSDTIFSTVMDQQLKVHSSTNGNGNRTTANFLLPPNTVSWGYFIGVDQAGQKAWAEASAALARNTTSSVSKIPGFGPLAALALNIPSFLNAAQKGEDIDYWLLTQDNANAFKSGLPFRYLKGAKVISDQSAMPSFQEQLCFCFANDNLMTGVTVLLKVTAMQVLEQWANRPVQKMRVDSREEMYLKL